MLKLAEFSCGETRVASTVLVIDGNVLTVLLKPENVKTFVSAAIRAPAVVCCRCSPTQKASIVTAISKYASEGGVQKRTLAIGDGGNDVGGVVSGTRTSRGTSRGRDRTSRGNRTSRRVMRDRTSRGTRTGRRDESWD